MGFYLLLFFLPVLAMAFDGKIENEKRRKIITFGLFIILWLVSGTRVELGGSDYYIYRRIYNAVPDLWHISELSQYLIKNYELGYLCLNILIKTLGFSFYGFALIESGIWYLCMYNGLKRYVRDWNIVFIVFLYKLFFYNTFISLRQAITIALFFVALSYIQDKKWVRYYTVCCIAVLFHNGAIVLFLLYPLLQIRLTKTRLLIANVLCWALYVLGKVGVSILPVLRYVLAVLASLEGSEQQGTLLIKAQDWLAADVGLNMFHILEYMLLMFLVVMYYEKIVAVNKNAEFIIKVFLVLLPIFAIFSVNIVSTRFKDYFTITYGLVLAYLCEIAQGRLKWIVRTGTVLVCAYGYVRYLRNFDAGGLLPYFSYLGTEIRIFK